MKKIILIGLACFSALQAGPPSISPSRVVVLYNSDVPESLQLAKLYQRARFIPSANLIGLKMPDREEVTGQEYDELIRKPLREEFRQRGWWKWTEAEGEPAILAESRMQVMVCMRGVPLKIARLSPPTVATAPSAEKSAPSPDPQNPLAVANEAAVDSELSILSWSDYETNGAIKNPFFESTHGWEAFSFPNVLLVGRIDGPSFAVCQQMIRDAIQTEPPGLWGLAYVDLAQFYSDGETCLRTCAVQSAYAWMPVIVHPWNEVFPEYYPMH